MHLAWQTAKKAARAGMSKEDFLCLITLTIPTYTSTVLRDGDMVGALRSDGAMADNREWLLKRNCSISPRQLMQAYSVLCMASLAIAIYFTFRGAWFILGFSLMELTAVTCAFIHYARHATDREHIVLTDDWLLVELVQGEKSQQFRLVRHRTIIHPAVHNRLIGLESSGTRVEVGRFLTEYKRRQFVHELRQELGEETRRFTRYQ